MEVPCKSELKELKKGRKFFVVILLTSIATLGFLMCGLKIEIGEINVEFTHTTEEYQSLCNYLIWLGSAYLGTNTLSKKFFNKE